MNAYQHELYQNLMELCSKLESFYYKDFELDDKLYRIFNYRLASYTDFMNAGALECRGTMFEVINDIPVRLASLPLNKFFNMGENPQISDLNPLDIVDVMHKMDGSLAVSYLHNNKLKLRTKGSLFSEQAIAAEKFLYRPENYDLLTFINVCETDGFTVNAEYVAPTNRIVIGYEKEDLIILNVRNRFTGQTFFRENFISPLSVPIAPRWVQSVPKEQFDCVKEMVDVEGFVVRMNTGQLVKVKCDWYLTLHHTKDTLNSPRRLYEAILEEAADDLRSMFSADPVAIKMIDEMQVKTDHLYNHLVSVVENYYTANKELDRKSYAIKGQSELDPLYFGLAMSLYLGKPVDYKAFLKKKWKEFGIKDEEVIIDDNAE